MFTKPTVFKIIKNLSKILWIFGALEHGVFGATKLKVSMAQKSPIFVSFDFCEIENAIAFSISSILRPHKQSLQTFHVCAFENLRFSKVYEGFVTVKISQKTFGFFGALKNAAFGANKIFDFVAEETEFPGTEKCEAFFLSCDFYMSIIMCMVYTSLICYLSS